MMSALLRSTALSSFLLATFSSGSAAPAPPVAPADLPNRGTFTFYFENDLFGGTDDRYTNGARIGWSSPSLKRYSEAGMLGGLAGFFDTVPYVGDPGFEKNVAFTLGQNMYTPSDTQAVELIEDDRPYAGWLYLGLGLIWKNSEERNSLVINVGVVGPWSFAEETQRLVHEARGIAVPRGWDNQLENELAIALGYEKTWRLRHRVKRNSWDWDLLPYAGVTVGNVAINARTGTEARFGWNLPDDFGTASIGPAATTPAPVEESGTKAWSHSLGAHLFVRAEGRAVARDIFLDGNTFEDSHSIDKEPFVGDLAAGLSVNWRNTKLTYAYFVRSEEFRGQKSDQAFGSLTLNITF